MTSSASPHPLRIARLEAALTQEELAHRAGLTVRTVNQIENFHRTARPSTRRKLAAALRVHPKDLMEEIDGNRDSVRARNAA